MVPEALRQTKILRFAGEILGFENYALFMVVGAAAMILGLTGFLYLHSKKQIDFYNSLPVKREMLFTVKFLDGFLIILAAYLINMFAAFGIFCGNGIAAGDLFKMMFASFAVNMIGFLLIYVVMVIAVLLTGNLFISILGAGVLYGYLPAVSLLIEGLKSLFFVTRGREGDVYWQNTVPPSAISQNWQARGLMRSTQTSFMTISTMDFPGSRWSCRVPLTAAQSS